MTKEQAIRIISKYLNFNEICGTRNFKEAIETVLSMLKEKDKEIEKLKKENDLAKEQLKKQCEIADERNDLLVKVQELQKENKEKDEEISNLKIENNNAWEDWNNLEQASYEEELRLKEKIKEKDKTIDLMAEQLAGLTIWNNEKEEPLILYDKEEVKKYFERKVEDVKNKR